MNHASVERTLKTIHMRETAATSSYDDARAALRRTMITSGVGETEADDVIEAYENASNPAFGQAAQQRGVQVPTTPMALMGNDLNKSARQNYDAALRNKVGPAAFDTYAAALKEYRNVSTVASKFKERAFDVLGAERFSEAVDESSQLENLRKDVDDIFKSINPSYTLDVLYPPEINGEASNDMNPLRRVVTLALDPARASHTAYAQAFKTVSHLLDDNERSILFDALKADNPGLNERDIALKASEAFANDTAPVGRRRRPQEGIRGALKPLKNFVERISNAARLRGFRNADDIWRSVREGALATRESNDTTALRVPSSNRDKDAHTAYVKSVGTLTGDALAIAIEKQHQAIGDAQKNKKNRKLMSMSHKKPRRQAARSEQQSLRDLLRGRALLLSEQRNRSLEQSETILNSAGMTPEPPDRGPTGPKGPTQGMEDILNDRGWRPTANDNGNNKLDVPAQRMTYQVERHITGDEKPFFTVATRQTSLGMFGNEPDVADFIEALEAGASKTTPGQATQALLAQVTSADRATNNNADIDTIRKSGLLDTTLDTAIGERSASAFVYPLKNGDLIWESPQGWTAGTLEKFEKEIVLQGGQKENATALAVMKEAHPISQPTERTREGTKTQHTQQEEAPRGRVRLDVPPSEEMNAIAKGARYDDGENAYYASDKTTIEATKEWQNNSVSSKIADGQRGRHADKVEDVHVTRVSRQAAGIRPEEANREPAQRRAATYKVPTAEEAIAQKAALYRELPTNQLTESLSSVDKKTAEVLQGKSTHQKQGVDADDVRLSSLSNERLAITTVLKERGIGITTANAKSASENAPENQAPKSPKRKRGVER